MLQSHSISEEKPGQNARQEPGQALKQRHRGVLLPGLLSLISYITQAPRPGVAPPTVSWTLSHPSPINQEDAPQATLVEAFSQMRFLLPRRLEPCEADTKLSSVLRNQNKKQPTVPSVFSRIHFMPIR